MGDKIQQALALGQKAILPAEPLGLVETVLPGRTVPRVMFLESTSSTPALSVEAPSLHGALFPSG
jgi:hypothetical protein